MKSGLRELGIPLEVELLQSWRLSNIFTVRVLKERSYRDVAELRKLPKRVDDAVDLEIREFYRMEIGIVAEEFLELLAVCIRGATLPFETDPP